MNKITFVKTRHLYKSYTDFWKLVELSGFSTIYVDELNVKKPGVYIVTPMNGEWRPHIDNQKGIRNAHLILWNLERPAGSGSIGKYGADNRELLANRYIDEVWLSDRRLAEETGLRYVTLGSHPDLGQPGNIEDKIYDFCHMSYLVNRRQSIIKHFSSEKIGPNSWGDTRDNVLKRSKFALNVHQDEHPFQEPLRFALFAAYGLPIVSESLIDSYPLSDETSKLFNYDELVENLRKIIGKEYNQYYEMGQRLRQLLCFDMQFATMIEKAIQESVGDWR